MADALSYLKFISSDKKVILNLSSMFSGNLDRNIMDFLNDEEELLITFEKDTVDNAYIAAREDAPLVNMKVTPNLGEVKAFIDKEYGYGQRIHLQLFMALLITLKLVLVVLNHLQLLNRPPITTLAEITQ